MQVSRARVKQQADMLRKLSLSAARVIERDIKDLAEDEIVRVTVRTAKAYADMSGALTATYYGEIRSAAKPKSKFTPYRESGFLYDYSYAAARSIMDEWKSGRATVPLSNLLGNYINREIKNAADFCINNNALRDPARPRYAIVPSGGACAFCVMRASLGYMYPTEGAVTSHNHCTCVATPVFGNMKIQGYDAGKYKGMYNKAAEAYRSGDVSKETMQKINNAKAAHEAKYKAGEISEKWDSTNAILMVMREQQGIK